jgi:hypothetical protein
VRRAHWGWQDPREASLLPAVSADSLMTHARAIAAWERESGSPGEARAFDYIERCLKRYGLEVERRLIEAFTPAPAALPTSRSSTPPRTRPTSPRRWWRT